MRFLEKIGSRVTDQERKKSKRWLHCQYLPKVINEEISDPMSTDAS